MIKIDFDQIFLYNLIKIDFDQFKNVFCIPNQINKNIIVCIFFTYKLAPIGYPVLYFAIGCYHFIAKELHVNGIN